ncbi:MAG TPA: hypothetical protein VF904_03415 [Anaeromyxobacteraceae bacterium]
MTEIPAHLPLTYVAGTVKTAFEEFETTLPGAKGFRCLACKKDYIVSSERELPAHDCTGTYAKEGRPVTAL